MPDVFETEMIYTSTLLRDELLQIQDIVTADLSSAIKIQAVRKYVEHRLIQLELQLGTPVPQQGKEQ